ncbi:uncharacterized protein CDAR_387471 [Caerostris darwini]|uniref:Uncharacterized protein n=1 Tax=Caerostris darwini TaxID=1538125 RepID=A0AAV4TT79_9ARAC|nr:uncharacterized protein CDAR_387471 [Caerostris darwini]
MDSNVRSMTEEKLPQEKNLLPPFVVNPELRRESEITIVEILFAQTWKSKYLFMGWAFWRVFKCAVFITCFTIFFYQSLGFYSSYYRYPTTINIAVEPATDFKFPAITFCHNNVLRRSKFCLNHTDFCQAPKHLPDFCRKHPHFCSENNSSLVIPKLGYHAEKSKRVLRYVRRSFQTFDADDFSYVPFNLSNGEWKMTLVVDQKRNGLTICYSKNLHLYSNKEPETRDLVSEAILEKEVTLFYTNFKVLVSETFYPWDTPELLFYIHSPFDPITLLQGKTLRPGFQYSINVDLEEEHLLESPYPTNCANYSASWIASNKTGPRSQEMCRQTCLKHYSKQCYDCYYGLAMYENSADMCPLRPHVCFVKNRDELWANLQTCVKNCKTNCVKLKYQYTLVEKPFNAHQVNHNLLEGSDRIDLTIYVKDAKVVVLRHKQLYGFQLVRCSMKWDLFSDIGGLIGCWLGISVWALVGIIESFSYKASEMMHKIKQTPRDPLSSQDQFSLQQQLA